MNTALITHVTILKLILIVYTLIHMLYALALALPLYRLTLTIKTFIRTLT